MGLSGARRSSTRSNVWGKVLDSPVTIRVSASFAPLECDATHAVLGQAGSSSFEFDVPGQDPNLVFPEALADRIAGVNLWPGAPDIEAEFNGSLPECFPDLDWYYGLDATAFDDKADLVMTVLHEIGHGLGFASTVDDQTGEFLAVDLADPFTAKLVNAQTGKHWDTMTNAERLVSEKAIRGLVWGGTYGNAAAATWLAPGAPHIRTTPAVAGLRDAVIDANFGRLLSQGPVTGVVASPMPADACAPVSGVSGAIAVLPDAACHPLNQLAFAEDAGAIAGIVVSNRAPPPALDQSAEDLAVVSTNLLTLGMSEADAAVLLAAGPVTVELYAEPSQRSGTDAEGRVYMFAADPTSTSVASHLEPVLRPDAVLEPSQTANIHHDVTLERAMLRDIGWEVSCGNGMLDPGEACDLGPDNSDTVADRCRTSCELPKCGDGVVDSGEACDSTDTDAGCNPDCTLPVCGDGVVGPGEECDLGPGNSDTAPDACRTSCKKAFCGDAVVNSGEACDDAFTPDTCQGCVGVVIAAGTGGGAGVGGQGAAAGASAAGSAGTASGGAPGAGSGSTGTGAGDEPKDNGGCGCQVPGAGAPVGWRGALVLSLALAGLTRRRAGARSTDRPSRG